MGIETVGIRMQEWIRCRTCLSSYESLTGFVWSQWAVPLGMGFRGGRVKSCWWRNSGQGGGESRHCQSAVVYHSHSRVQVLPVLGVLSMFALGVIVPRSARGARTNRGPTVALPGLVPKYQGQFMRVGRWYRNANG